MVYFVLVLLPDYVRMSFWEAESGLLSGSFRVEAVVVGEVVDVGLMGFKQPPPNPRIISCSLVWSP